jgi:hypothetical protein
LINIRFEKGFWGNEGKKFVGGLGFQRKVDSACAQPARSDAPKIIELKCYALSIHDKRFTVFGIFMLALLVEVGGQAYEYYFFGGGSSFLL